MNAFLSQTIRKRKYKCSLSEALVEVYKKSYQQYERYGGTVQIEKKHRLQQTRHTGVQTDGWTIQLPLSGCNEVSRIHFTNSIFANYSFKFLQTDRIDDRLIYVIEFEQLKMWWTFVLWEIVHWRSIILRWLVPIWHEPDRQRRSCKLLSVKAIQCRCKHDKGHYQITEYRLRTTNGTYAIQPGGLNMKINWKKKKYSIPITIPPLRWPLPIGLTM